MFRIQNSFSKDENICSWCGDWDELSVEHFEQSWNTESLSYKENYVVGAEIELSVKYFEQSWHIEILLYKEINNKRRSSLFMVSSKLKNIFKLIGVIYFLQARFLYRTMYNLLAMYNSFGRLSSLKYQLWNIKKLIYMCRGSSVPFWFNREN